MSSWLSVPACWWLSFSFTSSSPVATHPKRPYSLVTNTVLSLSQPGNMFPNALTLQVNLRAATFCELISTFPELSHETQTVPIAIQLGFNLTFSKPLRLIGLRTQEALPRPVAAARGHRTSGEVTLEHKSQRSQLLQYCSFNVVYRQQKKRCSG